MKLAIMQPYIFPYIGYFQLIHAVDKFIVYDDVTYIKQGWINRNRILANGAPLLFTVPLSAASSNSLIRETRINTVIYVSWRNKFFKTLEQYYCKAPFYKQVLPIFKHILDEEPSLISELAVKSIKMICTHLLIGTAITETSTNYNNDHLKSENRIIDICKQEDAQIYVNAIGGQKLYSGENFKKSGIDLKFLQSGEIIYEQFHRPFVPCLSIIDVLMFNPFDVIQKQLKDYSLS